MTKGKSTLFVQLLLKIALPILLLYMFIILFTYASGKQNALQMTQDYLVQLVKNNAHRLDKDFAELAHTSRTIKHFIEINHPQDIEHIFDFISQEVLADQNNVGSGFSFAPYKFHPQRELTSYFIHRKDGDIIVTDLTEHYDYLSEDWYVIPQKINRDYWSQPFWGRVTSDIVVLNACPIEINGEIVGATYADITLKVISTLSNNIDIKNGYTFILSNIGNFVYHPNPDYVINESIFSLADRYDRPDMRMLGQQMLSFSKTIAYHTGQECQIESYTDFTSNDRKWIIYTLIPSTDWIFAAVFTEKDALADINNFIFLQVFIMLAGLVMILLIIWYVSSTFSNRISKLVALTHTVAGGNLEVDKAEISQIITKNDEITELGNDFTKMLNNLKQYIANLTKVTREKEAIASEMRIARQIQESLLPHIFPPFPHRKEFDLYAINIPAREVAGDFYDFFFLNQNQIAILMADVSGKGVSAGLFMAITKTLINLICTTETSPQAVLEKVNKILCKENENGMFVTVFLAYFDTLTKEFQYSNAGHPYPLLISEDGSVKEIKEKQNTALGIFQDILFCGDTFTLKKNDIVVLYTDGITEAVNQFEEMYTLSRLQSVLQRNHTLSLDKIIKKVTDELDTHQGESKFDDITMLLFKCIV